MGMHQQGQSPRTTTQPSVLATKHSFALGKAVVDAMTGADKVVVMAHFSADVRRRASSGTPPD